VPWTVWKPASLTSCHGSSQLSTRVCTWEKVLHGHERAAGEEQRATPRGRRPAPWRSTASPRTRRRTAATSRGRARRTSRSARRPRPGGPGPKCLRSGSTTGRSHARHGQQLPLLHEVRGEEDGEHDLGELAGLEADRAEAHPDAGAVDRAADAGDERQQQQPRPTNISV
jgi:hypothetical protein